MLPCIDFRHCDTRLEGDISLLPLPDCVKRRSRVSRIYLADRFGVSCALRIRMRASKVPCHLAGIPLAGRARARLVSRSLRVARSFSSRLLSALLAAAAGGTNRRANLGHLPR